jgi:long-chain acyl-CoA synthetase
LSIQTLTLADLPRRASDRFGSRVALHAGDTAFTFAQMEAHIAGCAAGLEQIGVGAGDRVVLHLPNTAEWIIAYYAIARRGAVVVPANIMLVTDEVQFIADNCNAVAIIAPAARIVALQREQERRPPLTYIAIGDAISTGALSFERLLLNSRPTTSPSVNSNEISTICYTSGTTGRQKGAMLTHRAVVLNTAMTANMHLRVADDVVVTALPYSHVYGNVVMNGAFLCGYSLVLLERFDADLALEAIERHQATLFEGVPTMYYYLLDSASLANRNLGSLTRATVGGQTMPLEQMRNVQQRLGCPLLELWGMTEIAGLGTTHPAYASERLGSIGLPLPLSECRIDDLRQPGQRVAAGERGELMFRGPTVMEGYIGNAEATAEALRTDGWLHTGDIAWQDDDGYVYLVDRVKEMIITGGYNIYPSEVERVIAGHPAVQMVAVGATADTTKGELAHAYVVLRPGVRADKEALMAYCRAHLAAYKVPKAIHFVSDVPKTSTGKIIRRALSTLVVS